MAKIDHISATKEFKSDTHKMDLLQQMADIAYNKIRNKKQYLVKAGVFEHPFGLGVAKDYVYFKCETLIDLQRLLRCISPKGSKTPKAFTLGKWIKEFNGEFELLNKWNDKPCFCIRAITYPVEITLTKLHKNTYGIEHVVHIVESKNWK